MTLRAGKLREKIDIQAVIQLADGAGGTTKTWASFALAVPAHFEPVTGGETFALGVARSTQFYKVTIRWRGDVTPRNRIWWQGRALNIRTAADPDDGRREKLVMMAESGAPEPA